MKKIISYSFVVPFMAMCFVLACCPFCVSFAAQTVQLLVAVDDAAGPAPDWPRGVVDARKMPKTGFWQVWVDSEDVDDLVAILEQKPWVRYVEKSFDSGFEPVPKMGGFTEEGTTWQEVIHLSEMLQLSGGAGTVVALLDSGIDMMNADEFNRIQVNTGEIPGDGIDNDGNGYVDDVYGYDMGDMDADAQDEHGHGTHVMSVLLRTAPQAGVIPVKINPGGEGAFSTTAVAESIYYAVNRGADIINMSLVLSAYSQAVVDAIDHAVSSGVLVVAAAGNNVDNVQFPALLDNVVAVGSLHYSLEPAWFSPVGPEMEITAPGVLIDVTELGGGTITESGTSLSTPMVSGTAALLLSMNPNFTSATLRYLLDKGVNDLGEPGRDEIYGVGALDGIDLYANSTAKFSFPGLGGFTTLKSELLSVQLDLPATDVQAHVFAGVYLVPYNAFVWLGPNGELHDLAFDPLGPFMLTSVLTQSQDIPLYAANGLYPPIDAGHLDPGVYSWAAVMYDTANRQISPVTWVDLNLQ